MGFMTSDQLSAQGAETSTMPAVSICSLDPPRTRESFPPCRACVFILMESLTVRACSDRVSPCPLARFGALVPITDKETLGWIK